MKGTIMVYRFLLVYFTALMFIGCDEEEVTPPKPLGIFFQDIDTTIAKNLSATLTERTWKDTIVDGNGYLREVVLRHHVILLHADLVKLDEKVDSMAGEGQPNLWYLDFRSNALVYDVDGIDRFHCSGSEGALFWDIDTKMSRVNYRAEVCDKDSSSKELYYFIQYYWHFRYPYTQYGEGIDTIGKIGIRFSH